MKKCKRTISFLLTLVFIVSIFTVIPNTEVKVLADTIPADAIHIQTEAQLRAMALNGATGYYVLDNNITLVDEWDPINKFTGNFTFDGQGYAISNLYILHPDPMTNAVGFIGLAKSASQTLTIKNLGINISSQGMQDKIRAGTAGGLIGICRGTTIIENCYVSGGNINSESIAGGLIGCNRGTLTIKNSFSTSNVLTYVNGSDSRAGGLVGYCETGTTTIKNCYTTGNILASTSNGTSYAGGLIGQNTSSNTILNNNYRLSTQTITGSIINTDGTSLTPTQMKQQSSFENWYFDTVWETRQTINEGYPVLQALYNSYPHIVAESDFVTGFYNYNAYQQFDFENYSNQNCATIATCNLISYYKQARGFSGLYTGTYLTKAIHDEILGQLGYGPTFSQTIPIVSSYVQGKGYSIATNDFIISQLKWNNIKNAINNDIPVFYGGTGDNGKSWHIMFVTGYKVEDGSNFLYVNNDYKGNYYGWIQFDSSHMASSIRIY